MKNIKDATTLRELLDLYYDTEVDADDVIKAVYALGIKHGNNSKLQIKRRTPMSTTVTMPATRKGHDNLYRAAIKAGCKPFWHDGICGPAWHCGCVDLAHICDQQCSMITMDSLKRAR
jgi:hypothetical protein